MHCQKVPVKINKKTGKMRIEGEGFIGNECDVLENIESLLGTVETREDKDERYQYRQPDYLPNQVG